jgi:hypothetical protein
MTRRIQKVTMAVAALAALALGGAAFASAQSSTTKAPEPISKTDTDKVQSGNQTAPDTAKAASADPAGGGSGQSGSQTTPDTGSASETTTTETPETGAGSETTTPNDGPGGHADPTGSANTDHQFQGNE